MDATKDKPLNPNSKKDTSWVSKIGSGIKDLASSVKKNKKKTLMIGLFVISGLTIALYIMGMVTPGATKLPVIALYIAILMLATAFMLLPKIFGGLDKQIRKIFSKDEVLAVFKDTSYDGNNYVERKLTESKILEDLFSNNQRNAEKENKAIAAFKEMLLSCNGAEDITDNKILSIINNYITRELIITQNDKNNKLIRNQVSEIGTPGAPKLSDAQKEFAYKIAEYTRQYLKETGKNKLYEVDFGVKPNSKGENKNYLLDFIEKKSQAGSMHLRSIMTATIVSGLAATTFGIFGTNHLAKSIGMVATPQFGLAVAGIIIASAILLAILGTMVFKEHVRESLPESPPIEHDVVAGIGR